MIETWRDGMLILSPAGKARRRVLFVNSYGMAGAYDLIKQGLYPGHHLWGCLELVKLGYEVALPPAPSGGDSSNWGRAEFSLIRFALKWLNRDGILYCAHNFLKWTALLSATGIPRYKLVGLLFGREPLRYPSAYAGIIGMTPAACEQASRLAPRAQVAHLGWGVDLHFFPRLAYCPKFFLSCGKTNRDFQTLNDAFSTLPEAQLKLIGPGLSSLCINWTRNIELVTGGCSDGTISYHKLLNEYYSDCTAGLVVVKPDPMNHSAVGFTQLLETMAMSRPVILTRTGALVDEISLEKAGCGISVPANHTESLREALNQLQVDPEAARAMGERGRELCERHYNIDNFANRLHSFFETI